MAAASAAGKPAGPAVVAWHFARDTVSQWLDDGGPRLAAALAYYTGFSIVPLLLVVGGLLGLLSEEWGRNAIQELVRLIPGGGGDAVEKWLEAAQAAPGRSAVASAIAFVAVLAGAAGLFGQIQDALNVIWDVAPASKKSSALWEFVRRRLFSLSMLAGVAFLLLVSLLLDTALTFLLDRIIDRWPVLGVLLTIGQLLFSVLVATVVFALMFKVVPDAPVPWRAAWIGGFVTSVLFSLGQEALAWYLADNTRFSVYGAFTAVIVFLLWVYYSAQILLLGAEFTQVYQQARQRQKPAHGGAIRTPHGAARETSPGGVAGGTAGPAPPR